MYYANPSGKTAFQLAQDILAHVAKYKPEQRAIFAAHSRDTDPAYWRNVFSILHAVNVALVAIWTDDDFETNPPPGSPMVEYVKHRAAAAQLARELFCEPYLAVYGVLPNVIRYWDSVERGTGGITTTGNAIVEAYSWTNDVQAECDRLIAEVNRFARTINPVLVVSPFEFAGDDNHAKKIYASPAVRKIQMQVIRHALAMDITDIIYWNPDTIPNRNDTAMADFLLSIKPTKLSKPLPVIPADAKSIRTGNVVTNLEALRRAA